MKQQFIKLVVTFICVASSVCVSSAADSPAETQPSKLYAQAKSAYLQGKCDIAIKLFNKYKIENASKLKDTVEFSKEIDKAIEECIDKLSRDNYEHEHTDASVPDRNN